jgi:hypothetical protein
LTVIAELATSDANLPIKVPLADGTKIPSISPTIPIVADATGEVVPAVAGVSYAVNDCETVVVVPAFGILTIKFNLVIEGPFIVNLEPVAVAAEIYMIMNLK